MSCCGQARQALRYPQLAVAAQPDEAPLELAQLARETFEYVGSSGLTVIGPATGMRYVFPSPGARAAVDARDARSISSIGVLRWLRRG